MSVAPSSSPSTSIASFADGALFAPPTLEEAKIMSVPIKSAATIAAFLRLDGSEFISLNLSFRFL